MSSITQLARMATLGATLRRISASMRPPGVEAHSRRSSSSLGKSHVTALESVLRKVAYTTT
jgi:hypothetical protein